MGVARILDLEQALLLLELEAPFDKRQVQLARRRMAKRSRSSAASLIACRWR